MKMLAFAKRNRKEMMRDPLTLVFGVGFPVVLLLLMTIIERSVSGSTGVRVSQFEMQNLLPGLLVFGLSFLSLFSGMLLAGDRESSLLLRLFASPMKTLDYLLGYALPLMLVAVLQSLICLFVGLILGASLSWRLLLMLLSLLPCAMLFLGFGLMLGSFMTYKQVGGAASIVVNVAAWLSGTWFELALIGGAFERICYLLPFAHAVDLVRKAYSGSGNVLENLLFVILYALLLLLIAALLFHRRIKGGTARK
ncbi:MAG: ABC transporter permease [Clostridia bacterium]|nr:ABC transporter permease [Clostridia bacterium]